jgi:hypothetical protein
MELQRVIDRNDEQAPTLLDLLHSLSTGIRIDAPSFVRCSGPAMPTAQEQRKRNRALIALALPSDRSDSRPPPESAVLNQVAILASIILSTPLRAPTHTKRQPHDNKPGTIDRNDGRYYDQSTMSAAVGEFYRLAAERGRSGWGNRV